jgi:hypothetical protein
VPGKEGGGRREEGGRRIISKSSFQALFSDEAADPK